MALPGETVNAKKTKCIECGTAMELEVLRSSAGFYIGFHCGVCGPYSRESGYYKNKSEAEYAMASDLFER